MSVWDRSVWGHAHAVKVFPSGHVIYQRVRRLDVLTVPMAVKQIVNGRSVLIHLDDLHIFLVAMESVLEVSPDQLSKKQGSTTEHKD